MDVMKKCWATAAHMRPTFKMASLALTELQKVLARSEAGSVPRHASATGSAELTSVLVVSSECDDDDELLAS